MIGTVRSQRWPTSITFESYHPGSGDLVGTIKMRITEFSVTRCQAISHQPRRMESVWVDQTERLRKITGQSSIFGAAVVVIVLCGACGANERSGGATPASSLQVQPRVRQIGDDSSHSLLTIATQAGGDGSDGVDRLAELASSDAGDESYRMFEMTEAEFAETVKDASREKQEAVTDSIYAELRTMRVVLQRLAGSGGRACSRGRGRDRAAGAGRARAHRRGQRPWTSSRLGVWWRRSSSEQVAEARAEIAALGD